MLVTIVPSPAEAMIPPPAWIMKLPVVKVTLTGAEVLPNPSTLTNEKVVEVPGVTVTAEVSQALAAIPLTTNAAVLLMVGVPVTPEVWVTDLMKQG